MLFYFVCSSFKSHCLIYRETRTRGLVALLSQDAVKLNAVIKSLFNQEEQRDYPKSIKCVFPISNSNEDE